jgi:LPS export ABC transporter protein LptC
MRGAHLIKKPNLILVALICLIVVVEILIMRPSPVDTGEGTTTGMFKSIESMVQAEKRDDEVGYTIDGFHYTAVEGEVKHWEMNSTQAILYEKSRIVRAKSAKIKMFDPSGKITLIEGDEAFYKMGVKDLDLSGNVKVTFPDGFWIKTTKAHYASAGDKITSSEPCHGEANPSKGELMQMWGVGFEASKLAPDVLIHNEAHVRLRRLDNDEVTDVRSDHARVDRFRKIANFWMASKDKFVQSHQGTLDVKSRRQEATYDSDASVVKYMTAYDDVLIRETDPVRGKTGLKYATSQKADFLTQEDKILLSGFPSAYQEQDTLTGELIIIYRKKNLVEVTHANAFHEGANAEQQPPRQQ